MYRCEHVSPGCCINFLWAAVSIVRDFSAAYRGGSARSAQETEGKLRENVSRVMHSRRKVSASQSGCLRRLVSTCVAYVSARRQFLRVLQQILKLCLDKKLNLKKQVSVPLWSVALSLTRVIKKKVVCGIWFYVSGSFQESKMLKSFRT